MLSLGMETPFGKVAAVGWVGERYYWIVDSGGCTSMMPAEVMEPMMADPGQLELPLDGTLEGC